MKDKRGGARKGSGRKKKDVTAITITVPEQQLNDLDERGITNRSEAYSAAMDEWLRVHKEKIDPLVKMMKEKD